MTGKQLKNSILQWAIQGKLVPQDPADEPASVLLDRIRAEKARLIKEKKIKKPKNESIIYRGDDNSHYEKFADGTVRCIDDEIPFEIPQGWEWTRLNDVFNFIDYRGATPTKLSAGIPLITAKNVKQGYIDYTIRDFISYEEFNNRQSRGLSKKGDILFTTEAPLGNAAIADLEVFSAGQRLIALQSYYPVNNQLFLFFILSPIFQEMIRSAKTGTTVAGIKASKLKDILLPIPPLTEQTRIVDNIQKILDKIRMYDSFQSELTNLNEKIKVSLQKSILQEAIQGHLVPQDSNDEPATILLERIKAEKERLVKDKKIKRDKAESVIFRGDDNCYYEKKGKEVRSIQDEIPFEIPRNWGWARVSMVFWLNPKNEADDAVNAAFIPMEKIDAGFGSSFSYNMVKWSTIRQSYTHLADGDVAFAKITPCFQNRKSAIFSNLPNGIGAGSTELRVLRPYGDTMDRLYLLYFLESPYFIDEATFKGTANQQRIIVGYLENKLFPIPPLEEQHRIVAKIEQLFQMLK